MTRIVEVRTGARLHFGLFDVHAEQDRLGGIGMMIDRPRYVLRAQVASSAQDSFRAPREVADRVGAFIDRLRSAAGFPLPACEIEVLETIPPHRGYGSGTQLSLAVAAAIQAFAPSPLPLGALGRAKRSAVGASGFHRGGFLFDPAATEDTTAQGKPFPGVLRYAVPEAWRIVIVDPRSESGPFGSSEAEAFGQLQSMPAALSKRLRTLATDNIVPALERRAFRPFAQNVAEFNRLVGEHFAPAQGDVYAHPLIRQLARQLAQTDWPHLAQSSWGPTAAVFCESEESAQGLLRFLATHIPETAATLFVATPRNQGAEVNTIDR